jgi:dihydropteroate synthase
MTQRHWQIGSRLLPYGERTLVMGILNVTPDSFSDGGEFLDVDDALKQAERMIEEGADIIDIGGESTRPSREGSERISVEEEITRVVPVIERLSKISDVPISIDTTKTEVARAATENGAEIINDISALRFEPKIADVAASTGAGLVLMHSRGTFETMHKLEPLKDFLLDMNESLRYSIEEARMRGCKKEQIAIDPGFGFSKSYDQNLELMAKLEIFADWFSDYPLLVGTSRKSFIGRILNNAPTDERLHGTMATVAISVMKGANIVRVHDVKAAVETVRVVDAIKSR